MLGGDDVGASYLHKAADAIVSTNLIDGEFSRSSGVGKVLSRFYQPFNCIEGVDIFRQLVGPEPQNPWKTHCKTTFVTL